MSNSAGIAQKSHAKPRPRIDDSWMRRAICRGSTAEFYADNVRDTQEAKELCLGCPVRLACLHYAIQRREYGVWGGTTLDERRNVFGVVVYG